MADKYETSGVGWVLNSAQHCPVGSITPRQRAFAQRARWGELRDPKERAWAYNYPCM